MERLPHRLLSFMLAASLLIPPGILQAQPEGEKPAVPPVAQQPVREGDFAIKLAASLGIKQTEDEVDAETRLGDAGIVPRNGWIADYPVTPDIVGELQQSVRIAVDTGKLPMGKEEALKRLDEAKRDMGLVVRPYTAADEGEKLPETARDYPNPTVINNYYDSEGPPIVTYYTPPPDYYYLYNWVAYPFFSFGFWFPGFFVLHDFHRPFRVHNRVRFVSNHFNDVRRHRVFRVDPGARFNGRTFAGIGVSRSRDFIPTGVRRGERRIFNSPRTSPIPGRSLGTPMPQGGEMRAPAGGDVSRMPSGGMSRMPSGGGGGGMPAGGSRTR